MLLQIPHRPMSITESSTAGSLSREEWEEEKDEDEESQQNTKDVVGALVIKSQSPQGKEGSQAHEVKKRLRSEEVVYQMDKRKRETYYRTSSERLRENVRKIGIITGCYGILFLHRHVLFHPSTDYVGM
jgi:hypothetical protein